MSKKFTFISKKFTFISKKYIWPGIALAIAIFTFVDHYKREHELDILENRAKELGEALQEKRWIYCPMCGTCGYVDDLAHMVNDSADASK